MEVTELDRPTAVSGGDAGATVPEGVTQTPGGVRIDVDISQPTAAQLAKPTEVQSSFLKSVPADFAEKPWVSELAKQENPMASMFKELENAHLLVGKKSEGLKVPAADAPVEEWQNFHKALGVPEKPDDYAYEAPKPPAGLEQYYKTDDNLLKTMRDAAHKAGVTPQGWKQIAGAFDSFYEQSLKEAVSQADGQIKAVQDTFAKHYGEKSPQVLASLDKASSSAPDWAKPVLDALQPATKAAIASLLHNFSTKYVSEDTLDVKGGASPTAMTQAEYGDRYEKLFAKVRETSKNPQSSEHLRAKQELANLRTGAGDIFKS